MTTTTSTTERAEPRRGARVPTIGVLAMQGAFREHVQLLDRLGSRTAEVRTQRDLDAVDALVVPGGESTTIRKQLDRSALYEPLRARLQAGMPSLGTCAGLIVLATATADGAPPTYGLLDVDVERNGFGRQPYSFEGPVRLCGSALATATAPADIVNGVFIRAPRITRIGEGVEVIARLAQGKYEDEPVAVRQGVLVGCTFHPELAAAAALHRLLMTIVMEAQ